MTTYYQTQMKTHVICWIEWPWWPHFTYCKSSRFNLVS